MTKILFIAYYFPPLGGAGVQRVAKFVQLLPEEGYQPIVVAGPASAKSEWAPHDLSLLAEIPEWIQVNHVAGPVPSGASGWKRRAHTVFGLPTAFSKWWVQSATEMALQTAKDATCIFATMPPFENAAAAAAVSRKLGIPWVADLRDPWAVDEIQAYPSWFHRRLELGKMEKVLSGASLIVMNTPEAAAALRKAFPRFKDKNIMTICNGYDGKDFELPPPARTDAKFRVVHAGTMLTDSGLLLRKQRIHKLLRGVSSEVDIFTRSPAFLIQAVEKWVRKRPEIEKDIELVFAGMTSASDEAATASVARLVRFPGYLTHAQSLELVRTADLLFLPMHNLPQGKRAKTVPGKMYEYMASGRPILGAVPDGDARDFLIQCGTARLCRPDDVSGMVQILDSLYGEWKSKISVAGLNTEYVAQFERRHLTGVLAKGIRSALGTAGRDEVYRAPNEVEREPASAGM